MKKATHKRSRSANKLAGYYSDCDPAYLGSGSLECVRPVPILAYSWRRAA